MKQNNMNRVIYRELKDLKKLKNNPRTIKKEDMERLKESIKNNEDYFEARPIILSNRTGELVIIAGNQRYEAAKALGMKEVPTFLLEGLNEEREKEIIIRDNVSNGDWDFEILANEWDAKDLEGWGGKELLGGLGNGLVDRLKESDYIEKEQYFIKKPFVIVFFDESNEEKLAKALGVEEIKDDVYDAKDL